MATVNFVGDIALFKEYQSKKTDPLKEIFLPESDFNIGNFEFIIPERREKYFFDVMDQYAVDHDYFDSLFLERFQAYGLANNHSMDYGKDGIEDVLKVLSKHKIAHFGMGSEGFNILKFELDEIKFAVIGAVKKGRWSRSETQPYGPDTYDIVELVTKIRSLKAETDHVIVFIHFGTELVDIPDPADVKNSRLMIDSGASAVIGHHPHIIQGIEEYGNGLIAYSLGSFIYIPENEQGYKTGHGNNRDYSICLNISFSRDKIVRSEPVYYRYDPTSKLPVIYDGPADYFKRVNSIIDSSKEYYKSVRNVLLKREIISFFQRFRNSPLSTLKHYMRYIKFSHIKKMIS